MDFVTASGQANDVVTWLLAERDDPQLQITFMGDNSFLDVELGDVLTFDTSEPELDEALMGLVPDANEKYRILNKSYGSDFKQFLSLISVE